MDSKTLMELKQMIEQRRDDMRDAVRAHLLKDGAFSDAFNAGEPQGDEGDQSVNDVAMEFMLRRGVREGQDLAAAQRALDRIVRGEYGVCVDCGEAIPVERLRVEPTTLRCVRDQSIREQIEEQRTPTL